jgi:hypothetical protein
MSPEQVKDEASDAHSDILSFCAVLYEILKRAFKRDPPAETMNANFRDEQPELNNPRWQPPPALRGIPIQFLEKNVKRRFKAASDLAFATDSMVGSRGTSPRSVELPKARRCWLPSAAAVVGMVVLAAAAGRWAGGLPKNPGLPV